MQRLIRILIAFAFAAGFTIASCAHDDGIGVDLGGSCATNNECQDLCLGSPGLGDQGDYPGGFCSARCFANNDCPRDAVCVMREGGVCLFGCDTNADCASLGAGWQCRTRDHITGFEVKVCFGN